MSSIIDEANESYETPDTVADKDEVMPSMRQEETSEKPIHRRTRMSKQKGRLQVQKYPCYARESLSDHLHDLREREFKTDRLRQRYDVRNKDPKEISNIFIRAHVQMLKKRTEEGKLQTGMKETFS
jgi:hypothetical protein